MYLKGMANTCDYLHSQLEQHEWGMMYLHFFVCGLATSLTYTCM